MRVIIILIFVTVYTHVVGQTISNSDSIEIANKIEDWNRGWKGKDYKLATKWYTAEAEFTNAFGHTKTGQSDIEKFMKEVFQLPFEMAGDSR